MLKTFHFPLFKDQDICCLHSSDLHIFTKIFQSDRLKFWEHPRNSEKQQVFKNILKGCTFLPGQLSLLWWSLLWLPIPQYKTIDSYQLQKCKWVGQVRNQEYIVAAICLTERKVLSNRNPSIHSYRACWTVGWYVSSKPTMCTCLISSVFSVYGFLNWL